MFARTPSRSFWQHLIRDSCFATSPHAFGFNPRSGSNLILKQFPDTPDMRGESSRHGRGARMPTMFGGAQLVMRQAKIVGTSDEVHARLNGLQTMSRMPTFAGEGSQAFTHGSIEAFNKGSVQLGSSHCCLKQLLRLQKGSQGHLAGDLNDVFVLHVFDHRRNTQLWPHL